MPPAPETLPRRAAGEWELTSDRAYSSPFTEVRVDALFTSPTGRTCAVPGFYDGENTWRVRFNPGETGRWRYRIAALPADPALAREGELDVTGGGERGFLRATPGRAWGFHYESGEPVFLLGDTTYNLFGMAHCGLDVPAFLERRASQGFNLLRVRLPVSPFHPPDGYSAWQTRRTWPWGGSEQAPRFDRFNLEYFRAVDGVVRHAERLGLGLEMIMEGWGFEFPFNSRQIFLPEWEELWLRYLIARYDAFNSVFFWTPLNEYEYYPNGDWHYKQVADLWAMRIARWIKATAGHGHILSMHNGPREPAFARRFAADPEAVDAILFQDWGTRDAERGWLAAGIEEQIDRSLEGWWGSAVLAEWGYERNPDLDLLLPSHLHCCPGHTRRGAWRGAFRALGVIHGFENSWGPWAILHQDQPGLESLLHLRRFLLEIAPFPRLRPAPELVPAGDHAPGRRPLALAAPEGDLAALYLPAGGAVTLPPGDWTASWFDPRAGDLRPAERGPAGFAAPEGEEAPGRPWDWILLLRR